ncbi:MAG: tryptophan synthase subunit alpha, partial [Bacteroidia bacterium]|nr:tryptophan synthase subunit alpha [Bacteroidia bacterium]
VYHEHYQDIFEKYGLKNIFLITPQTSAHRIGYIDSVSDAFIYMVSSASTTGAKTGFGDVQMRYFERISNMELKNPQIVGFGISNHETFNHATRFSKGAIIGSAFIKFLKSHELSEIGDFIGSIRKG